MDHAPLARGPFALHPKKVAFDPNDQVIALVLRKWRKDGETETRRLLRDRQLGYVALVV